METEYEYVVVGSADESWRAKHMRRYFERIERCEYRPVRKAFQRLLRRNPRRHGFTGWLNTITADPGRVLGDVNLLEMIKDSAWRAFTDSRETHRLSGVS